MRETKDEVIWEFDGEMFVCLFGEYKTKSGIAIITGRSEKWAIVWAGGIVLFRRVDG